MNETTVTVVGNVISDLRQRRTLEGTKLVSFRVASNERRYDKAAEQWVDGDHLFVNVTCWRKLATGVAASLTKGDPVVVTGRLSTRSYEVEGQRRFSTELEAVSAGPDLARCTAEVQRPRREPQSEGTRMRLEPVVASTDGAGLAGDMAAEGVVATEMDSASAAEQDAATALAAAV